MRYDTSGSFLSSPDKEWYQHPLESRVILERVLCLMFHCSLLTCPSLATMITSFPRTGSILPRPSITLHQKMSIQFFILTTLHIFQQLHLILTFNLLMLFLQSFSLESVLGSIVSVTQDTSISGSFIPEHMEDCPSQPPYSYMCHMTREWVTCVTLGLRE